MGVTNNFDAAIVAAAIGFLFLIFKCWLKIECKDHCSCCTCSNCCGCCDCCDDTVSYPNAATTGNNRTYYSTTWQTANQTTDIWNISGRVNHQDGPVTSEPQRWPTHDHHVSLDSFVIPETHQHNKKDRIPPPPYSEVDLPTYEQAVAVQRPKDELASVHVVPSSSRNCDANAS